MSGYKRSQVETCLWQIMRAESADNDVPSKFRSRIKKVLDLDRQIYTLKSAQKGGVRPKLAFNDDLAGGQGWDVPFREVHAFMLAIALVMLNAGFKQSEVVDYLQRFATPIKKKFDAIRNAVATVETLYSPATREPLVADTNGGNLNEKASARVYMIIDRIDFAEILGVSKGKPSFAPYFVGDLADLAKMIADRHLSQRAVFLVELADLVARIRLLLPESPARRRGPPSH